MPGCVTFVHTAACCALRTPSGTLCGMAWRMVGSSGRKTWSTLPPSCTQWAPPPTHPPTPLHPGSCRPPPLPTAQLVERFAPAATARLDSLKLLWCDYPLPLTGVVEEVLRDGDEVAVDVAGVVPQQGQQPSRPAGQNGIGQALRARSDSSDQVCMHAGYCHGMVCAMQPWVQARACMPSVPAPYCGALLRRCPRPHPAPAPARPAERDLQVTCCVCTHGSCLGPAGGGATATTCPARLPHHLTTGFFERGGGGDGGAAAARPRRPGCHRRRWRRRCACFAAGSSA